MAGEIVLKPNGQFFKRPVELVVAGERELNLDPSILASLQTNIAVKIPGAFVLPTGPVGLSALADGTVYASVKLSELILNVTVTVAENEARPSFENAGDFVKLVWPVPEGMSLVYTAYFDCRASGWRALMPHLFAFNGDGKSCYHLPIANLYDDCRVCTGLSEPTQAGTLADCFAKSLEQFEQSRWNADLIRSAGQATTLAASQKMFRFKVTKTGFTVLPGTGKDWQKLCKPVATSILEHVVL